MLIHISGNFNWNFQAVTVKQYFDKGSILALPRAEIPTTKVYWMKYGPMVRNRIYTIWILVKEGRAECHTQGSDQKILNLILANLWLSLCDKSIKRWLPMIIKFMSGLFDQLFGQNNKNISNSFQYHFQCHMRHFGSNRSSCHRSYLKL